MYAYDKIYHITDNKLHSATFDSQQSNYSFTHELLSAIQTGTAAAHSNAHECVVMQTKI